MLDSADPSFDSESLACRLLEDNNINPADPRNAIQLAYLLLPQVTIEWMPFMKRKAAEWDHETNTLYVKAGQSRPAENHLVAHEISHAILKHHLLYWPEFVERQADALAAALLIPGPAMRWAVREYGRNLPRLSAIFEVSESIIHLRLGEVFGSPLALVTPHHVHVRGEIEWGNEHVLRAMASGRRPCEPHFERVTFTDTRRNRGLVLLTG